jgi:hypothetical protein
MECLKVIDPYQRHIEECVRLISSEVSEILINDETRPAGISKEHALALTGASEGHNLGMFIMFSY